MAIGTSNYKYRWVELHSPVITTIKFYFQSHFSVLNTVKILIEYSNPQ